MLEYRVERRGINPSSICCTLHYCLLFPSPSQEFDSAIIFSWTRTNTNLNTKCFLNFSVVHMHTCTCIYVCCVLCFTITWLASLLLVIPLCCGGWRKSPLKVGWAVGGGRGWHCQSQCIGLPLLGSAPVPGCVGTLGAGISLQHLCGCAAGGCPGVAAGQESTPLFRAAGGWLRSNLVWDGVDPVVGILLV